MPIDWRFFADMDNKWRWEKSSPAHGTTSSMEAYRSYDECVAAASEHGYVFLPSQTRIRPGSALIGK